MSASVGRPEELGRLEGVRRGPLEARYQPQLATSADAPPGGEEWLHEIKLDGYRFLVYVEEGQAKLFTRNGKDWSHRFPHVARQATELAAESVVLDGELVALRPDGTADFQALQNALDEGTNEGLYYYVFDLLYLDGHDLTGVALERRKAILRALLLESGVDSRSPIRFCDHIRGQGEKLYGRICSLAMEGIVSKRADAPYLSGRTKNWQKIKCARRQEFVVGGFSEARGSRQGFGALLVGFYEGEKLVYAGRVGTGFSDKTLEQLGEGLRRLEQQENPFFEPDERLSGSALHSVHWVKPVLVAEVEFTSWTRSMLLRHPSFKGLRGDKEPGEVTLEGGVGVATKETPQIHITSAERLYWPEAGITKRELVQYFEEVADLMLPHVVGRPLTLRRCPQGYDGHCFYQRHYDESFPRGVIPVEVPGEERPYLGIDSVEGLLGLAQIGALELHAWGSRNEQVECPDRLVFDLDPGPGVTWREIVEGARLLRAQLDLYSLQSFVRTTGSKGLHLVVPVVPRYDWEQVKVFSRHVAMTAMQSEPRRFTASMSKEQRQKKIFIDYHRNRRGATAVATLSPRALKGAPVAVPLHWSELEVLSGSDHFTLRTVRRRLQAVQEQPWPELDRYAGELPLTPTEE